MRMLDNIEKQELVFSLDIGTRTVIGVVCAKRDEMFEVLCVESMEHPARAMVDGQIEDIEQTARVAYRVKQSIENKLGIQLTEVHVAAAGRILCTQKSVFEMDMGDLPINRRQMFALESNAVQKAFEELMNNRDDRLALCCAGYSVLQYSLDGYSFSTLLGHRGKKAKVEVIATFLPEEVIESLYTTMEKIGLNVASVTLEPIAAMNAVIPKELRLLNIALVDIGAGTSDIAISSKGSVVAYTMSTVAGDEITEQTMREFLVDFQTAERMKQEVGRKKTGPLHYADILGNSYDVECEDFLQRIQPAVEQLAESISQKILEANGGPATAVFLVGGGSRTPGLKAMIAKVLGMEENRISVGGINYIKKSVKAKDKYLSVEYATPVGIAITAIGNSGQEEATVLLNGKRLRLLNSGTMRVVDVLLRGGYEYRKIMGHSGKSLIFELNGEKQKLRGEFPTLAKIEVNGIPVGITSSVQEGDEIYFQPAQDGADAKATIRDVAGELQTFQIDLFGNPCWLKPRAWINGAEADLDSFINSMDRVKIKMVATLGDLLEKEKIVEPIERIRCNGNPCGPEQPLQEGDRITLEQNSEEDIGSESGQAPRSLTGAKGKPISIFLNDKKTLLPPKSDNIAYQLFDLLTFVPDIDLEKPKGKAVLIKNQKSATFLDPITEGDKVQIYWEEQTV